MITRRVTSPLRTFPRRTALGAMLVAALAAAGCGTSAKEQRDQFLADANRICRHFDSLQNQVRFPAVNPVAVKTTHAQRAEWAVSLKQIAYLGQQEVKALRKLDAPDALRDRFRTLVDTKDGAYERLLAGADAARRNRRTEIAAPVKAGQTELARASRIAKALGAAGCA